MQKLVLIRGLSGTGKTTLAKSVYTDCILVEADQWRETINGYEYLPEENGKAHEWCRLEAERQLRLGVNVVVTGVFYRREWVEWYRELARKYNTQFVVIETSEEYSSSHGVPREHIEKIHEMWEEIE